MTDKPEAVAVIGKDWSLLWASAEPLASIVERTGISIGTPLYPAPITLHESQVRWRQAFDEMHQRAMKAEAALATPAQPDAAALVKLQQALVNHNDVLRSAYQIAARQGNSTDWDGFTKRAGSVLHFHHDEVNAASAAIAAITGEDDARREGLRAMVAMDEELDREHPGWMTGEDASP